RLKIVTTRKWGSNTVWLRTAWQRCYFCSDVHCLAGSVGASARSPRLWMKSHATGDVGRSVSPRHSERSAPRAEQRFVSLRAKRRIPESFSVPFSLCHSEPLRRRIPVSFFTAQHSRLKKPGFIAPQTPL